MAALDTNRYELTGTPLSKGIVWGQASIFKQIDLDALREMHFVIEETDKELERFHASIEKSKEQLKGLQKTNLYNQKDDIAAIFEAQTQLLHDSAFIEEIKYFVLNEKVNIEYILSRKISDLEEQFESIENELLRTRLFDIQDVYHRVLRNLLEIEHVRVTPLVHKNERPILVAERLLPSDVALLEFRKIGGIIIEDASVVSHVAIMTKSFGIPAVVNIPGIVSLVRRNTTLILDGHTGKVICNPTTEDIAFYARQQQANLHSRNNHHFKSGHCVTKDGIAIKLEANASTIEDMSIAYENGAEGIGLFRTEIFHIAHTEKPSDEEERSFYRRVVSISENKPITIRVMDVGGDKLLPFEKFPHEENPQMGVRGIRFLIHHPDLFRHHLRNILHAAQNRQIKLLLPFIATPNDIDTALVYIDEACHELHIDRNSIEIGMMVEIPSIIWSLPAFIHKIDFLSIGTNDLVQFLFATSREDGRLDEYRRDALPVLLTIIRYVHSYGTAHDKDVSICGEAASDPYTALLLVGVGCRHLSVAPGALDSIRKEIEGKSTEQARAAYEALIREYEENHHNHFNLFA